MRSSKTIVGKLYILAILFITFTVSISVHYVLDTGQAQKKRLNN